MTALHHLLGLMTLLCCSASSPPEPPPEPVVEAPPPPPEPPPQPAEVTVVAVGDVLPHRAVKATGAKAGWDLVFRDVAPAISKADIAFANLESPVAPVAHTGTRGEIFNAPTAMLDGLKAAGFDVLSVANNHAFDQGTAGLLETLGHVTSRGMQAVGAGATCGEATSPAMLEVHGLTIAFVATADLTNIDLNNDPDEACVFWAGAECAGDDCGPDRDAIHFRPDLTRLVPVIEDAAQRSDFVIVSFHWGDEYRTQPLPEYPGLASELVAAGADVILGHHPHVLQPITRVGDGLVAYSLGNFVSNMAANYDPSTSSVRRGNTRDGALLAFTLTKYPDGSRAIRDVGVTPLWTLNSQDPVEVRVTTHAHLPDALTQVREPAVRDILGAFISTK